MNGVLVLALFPKNLVLRYSSVIPYGQQFHIGTNVNYLCAIIISIHIVLSQYT